MPQPIELYINDMLSRGYKEPQIKTALLKAGYSKQAIEQYFQEIKPKHIISSFKFLFIFIIILFIIAALGYLTFQYLLKPSSSSITLTIENPSIQENSLTFNLEISSAQKRKFSLPITYELKDSQKNLIYTENTRTSFDTATIDAVEINLPEPLQEGNYILTVSTFLEGKKVSASKAITKTPQSPIQNPQSTFQNPQSPIQNPQSKIQNPTCDDSNQCTKDYIENENCIHEQIKPCCGNTICESEENERNCDTDCIPADKPLTRDEIVEKAKSLTAAEPDKASTYCRQLIFVTDRDLCYKDIAETAKAEKYCTLIDSVIKKDQCFSFIAQELSQSAYCGSIQSTGIRDQCYVQFIVKGDYSLCDRLTDDYLKESCRVLAR